MTDALVGALPETALEVAGEEATAGFRLSPPQRLLWRRVEESGFAAFGARARVDLSGPLDRAALARAVARLAARHDLLRTAFRRPPAMTLPLQVVAAEAAVPLVERDLSALAEPERSAVLERLWNEAWPPAALDLERAPLARVDLAVLAAGRAVLVISLPALLGDAAGLANLIADLAALYAAEMGAAEEPEEPLQYADLAGWQWELLESEETAAGRDHWARQPPPAADEPDLPAPRAGGGYAPRRVRLALPADVARGAADLARRAGAPPADLLLAAWRGFLARWAGSGEVAVAFDGRKFAELATVPGLFVRWIPLLGAPDLAAGLDATLAGTGRDLADHRDWQEYFPAAGEGAAPPPLPFAFEELPAAEPLSAAGVRFEIVRLAARSERSLLALVAGSEGEVELEFDAGRIAEGDAERIAEGFAALLAAGVAHPDRPLAELPIVGERERRRLLAGSAGPRIAFPGPPSLYGLFERQAEATPDRVALAADGFALTYAELDARAARLAAHLAALGVGPERIAAVCLERSPELVVALLAVLRAGGAYLPLDPGYPRERLEFMLADARPRALVAGPGAPADLAPPGLRAVDLRLPISAVDGSRAAFVRPEAGAAHLAYVIYTSGSTGRPKGTLVSHGAIANRLLWMRDAFPLGPGDAVLHKTPFSFDASIWEIFLPLLCGSRVELAEPLGHRDASYLVRAVADRRVTVLQLVPSMLGPFLDEVAAGEAGSRCRRVLRRLFCGGETLPAALASRSRQLLGAEVCNLYGPTEAAIDATFHPAIAGDAEGPAVPIGRPLDNVRVLLLAPRRGLAPDGAVGEIHIGGAGLARGYLDRPDLTAERFVPDPWSGVAGARLYTTGDLARRRPDGALEFLGRIDDQVKLRGLRIELAEIESALAAHPGVAEAAVALREDPPGPADAPGAVRLVAYLVPRPGATVAEDDLLARLAARLPRSMVPTAFVALQTLPRLPNGKVDRRALPAPAARSLAAGSIAPRTPTEEVLAARWAEVLGVPRLGVYDDVYELGWHSLLATQLASKLRRTFGVEVPLRALFERPTVAALAARIDSALRGDPSLEPPPLAAAPRGEPLPLSFGQARLWFLDRLEPGNPFYNIPMALAFRGRLDARALARALAEVRSRHESLRTTFVEIDERPFQVIGAPLPVPLPHIDLEALPDGVRERAERRLRELEAAAPFDLERGPLLRARLLRLGPEDHVGLFTVHHIVSDGWSTGLLVAEVAAIYGALAAGREPALSAPAIQYADFARWQREWLEGEALDAQADWWRRHLEGAPAVLDLPSDRSRPEVQSFRGATRARPLPGELAAGVAALARREGATPFMVLFAAGAALLGWWGGTDDLVIGTDIAGRHRPETEGIVGFFINQLALRVRLDGDPTFAGLLGRVRESTFGAYAHQDLPFDALVEILRPERSAAFAPLFQVKLNLNNMPLPALELPGLAIAPLAVERGTAQFDWIWNVYESDGGWLLAVEYATDLFEAATAERLLADFEALLAAAVASPELRLTDLAEIVEEADARERLARQEGEREALRARLQRARRPAISLTEAAV